MIGQLWMALSDNGKRFVEAGLEWDDEHGAVTLFVALDTYPNVTVLQVNAQGMTDHGMVPIQGIKAGKHGVEPLRRALWPKAGED